MCLIGLEDIKATSDSVFSQIPFAEVICILHRRGRNLCIFFASGSLKRIEEKRHLNVAWLKIQVWCLCSLHDSVSHPVEMFYPGQSPESIPFSTRFLFYGKFYFASYPWSREQHCGRISHHKQSNFHNNKNGKWLCYGRITFDLSLFILLDRYPPLKFTCQTTSDISTTIIFSSWTETIL